MSQFIPVYISAPHSAKSHFVCAFAELLRLLALPCLPVRRSCCLAEQPEGKLLLGFVLKFVHAFQFWWKSDTNVRPLSWWPTYMYYYFCYVVITLMVTTVTLATFVNQDHHCFCGCFYGYANSSEVFLCAAFCNVIIRWSRWPRGVRLGSVAPRCWDCGFESHRGHGCLSVVSVVCCQVEVSASGWSLVQRMCVLSVIVSPDSEEAWAH